MIRHSFSMHRTVGPALASAVLLCATPAAGQAASAPTDLAQRQARALAATCAACHGTDGRAPAASAIPPLAGVAREQLAQRLLAFRDGSLPATVMHQIGKGYSPAQIDALAAWFSSQKPAP